MYVILKWKPPSPLFNRKFPLQWKFISIKVNEFSWLLNRHTISNYCQITHVPNLCLFLALHFNTYLKNEILTEQPSAAPTPLSRRIFSVSSKFEALSNAREMKWRAAKTNKCLMFSKQFVIMVELNRKQFIVLSNKFMAIISYLNTKTKKVNRHRK